MANYGTQGKDTGKSAWGASGWGKSSSRAGEERARDARGRFVSSGRGSASKPANRGAGGSTSGKPDKSRGSYR